MTALETIIFVFVTAVGACVGSFLNVVIYRLPAGESIVRPPSHCPKCDARLAWYDNIPMISWLVLRARCRRCGTPISWQYPLIELITMLLFAGFYLVAYHTTLRPDFAGPGIDHTWPIYTTYVVLFSTMLACVSIDARYFIIPIRVMWAAAIVAAIALPATAQLLPASSVVVDLPPADLIGPVRLAGAEPPGYENAAAVQLQVERRLEGPVTVSALPRATGRTAIAAGFAVVGLVIAIVGLATGLLPRSFDEPEPEPQPGSGGEKDPAPPAIDQLDGPDEWLAHPHPRREVCKELLFLTPPIVLAMVGYFVFGGFGVGLPPAVETAGGVAMGFLVGAAVVWTVRILGTLGFGKEAMGLGDMHLMAAVGAVAGWQVSVAAFFIAPFFGLTWALASAGAGKLLQREIRAIPYGPHLAAASLVAIVFREPLVIHFGALLGG